MEPTDPQIAYENAVLMQNGQYGKTRRGENVAPIISYLVERAYLLGIWINSQSINLTGSYKIQGKDKDQVDQLINDGLALQKLAAMTVLELMPTCWKTNNRKTCH